MGQRELDKPDALGRQRGRCLPLEQPYWKGPCPRLHLRAALPLSNSVVSPPPAFVTRQISRNKQPCCLVCNSALIFRKGSQIKPNCLREYEMGAACYLMTQRSNSTDVQRWGRLLMSNVHCFSGPTMTVGSDSCDVQHRYQWRTEEDSNPRPLDS